MNTKKIIEILEDIERITNFQQKRILDEKAVNKELVLKQVVELIENYCLNIRGELK